MKGEIRVHRIAVASTKWYSKLRWEALEHIAPGGWAVAYGRTRRSALRNLNRKRGRR